MDGLFGTQQCKGKACRQQQQEQQQQQRCKQRLWEKLQQQQWVWQVDYTQGLFLQKRGRGREVKQCNLLSVLRPSVSLDQPSDLVLDCEV